MNDKLKIFRDGLILFKESNQTATGSFKQRGVLTDFYRKGNIYIEKPSRRIKSSGELSEITFKGIWSLKNKKRTWGIKNIWGTKK